MKNMFGASLPVFKKQTLRIEHEATEADHR